MVGVPERLNFLFSMGISTKVTTPFNHSHVNNYKPIRGGPNLEHMTTTNFKILDKYIRRDARFLALKKAVPKTWDEAESLIDSFTMAVDYYVNAAQKPLKYNKKILKIFARQKYDISDEMYLPKGLVADGDVQSFFRKKFKEPAHKNHWYPDKAFEGLKQINDISELLVEGLEEICKKLPKLKAASLNSNTYERYRFCPSARVGLLKAIN